MTRSVQDTFPFSRMREIWHGDRALRDELAQLDRDHRAEAEALRVEHRRRVNLAWRAAADRWRRQ
jgi:hypothetical protein